MQPGYGGVSEFQQFVMDSAFAMSAPLPQQQQYPSAPELGGPFRYQPLHHHALPPMPQHFAGGGGGIPFTQKLLHQAAAAAAAGHHPHLQLFQEQQHHHHKPQPSVPTRWDPQQHHLGFDVEAAVPESSGAGGSTASGGGVPPFLAAAMNFKLGVDAGGGSGATGGTDDALNDGGGGSGMMLHVGADDEPATESSLRRWPGEEEASIKEPTWRPLDIDCLHSTSSSKKEEEEEESPALTPANYLNKKKKGDGGGDYKLFSELEAIYKPGSGGGAQTGSGSGLTGDENAVLEPAMPEVPGAAAPPQMNTSAGEDVAQQQQQQKRKRRRQLSAASSFFERLVQRVMEHQESLHRQFLESVERRERERSARDEAWRRQEAEKSAREAQDRASAAAREAAIVAYLEKLSSSGEEPVSLPVPAPGGGEETTVGGVHVLSASSRWPRQEVEALIRVRTGLEGRFQQEPAGLKGPLWEEVSSRMAAAGYGRSAKRCKEKWENMNKYFRKAKESGKKRASRGKTSTCPYFEELDRLYDGNKARSELQRRPEGLFALDGDEAAVVVKQGAEDGREEDGGGVVVVVGRGGATELAESRGDDDDHQQS